MRDGFDEWIDIEFDTVFQDIINSSRYNLDDAVDRISKELRIRLSYNILSEYAKDNRCNYFKAYDYLQTELGQLELNSRIEYILKPLIKNMSNKSVITKIEYSDEMDTCESELEHEVMSYLSATIF